MIEKIRNLEAIARELEPTQQTRDHWNEVIKEYSNDFLNDIDKRRAYIESREKGRGIMKYQIDAEPMSMEESLKIFHENVNNHGLLPSSGGHLAYIPGGGLLPSAWGDYLAALSNQYAGISYAGPGAVRMENMLIRWMCKLVGFPDTALGNLASGGSIANLIAVTTARDHHNIHPRDIENSVIYLTEQAHHSIQKAIRIAGLGYAKHVYIPIDDCFRMDARILKESIERDIANGLTPFLVVASAGTTDTGAVDPLDDIAALSSKYGLWFHIDAAYGGFFVMLDEMKAVFKGMEKADSITIDPHKGLFLAYGLGAVLIKNVEALQNSHYYQASYLQDVNNEVEEPSPADLSPELTKHFRGLRLWLPLQLFGVAPFKAAIEEKLWLCRYFYEKVQELDFEVGPYPELSVMIYRYVPETGDANEFNARIIEEVRKDGRVFLSSTTIDGVYWLRLAVLCFRTHLATIEVCLEVLESSISKVKNL